MNIPQYGYVNPWLWFGGCGILALTFILFLGYCESTYPEFMKKMQSWILRGIIAGAIIAPHIPGWNL